MAIKTNIIPLSFELQSYSNFSTFTDCISFLTLLKLKTDSSSSYLWCWWSISGWITTVRLMMGRLHLILILSWHTFTQSSEHDHLDSSAGKCIRSSWYSDVNGAEERRLSMRIFRIQTAGSEDFSSCCLHYGGLHT